MIDCVGVSYLWGISPVFRNSLYGAELVTSAKSPMAGPVQMSKAPEPHMLALKASRLPQSYLYNSNFDAFLYMMS